MTEGGNAGEGGGKTIARISIVVSLAAFSISAFEAYQHRQHDRESVRPLINFVYELDAKKPTVGLFIENDGLGPAIISSLTSYIGGKPVEDWGHAADNAHFDRSEISSLNLVRNAILKVGESQTLFSLSTMNKAELLRFINFVDQRVAVSVNYCSIAEQCETRCSSNVCQ